MSLRSHIHLQGAKDGYFFAFLNFFKLLFIDALKLSLIHFHSFQSQGCKVRTSKAFVSLLAQEGPKVACLKDAQNVDPVFLY